MRYFGLWMTTAVIMFLSLGCFATRHRTFDDVAQGSHRAIHSSSGQRVTGYTDAQGQHHEFPGRVRLIEGDSLEFVRKEEARGITGHDVYERRVLARHDVSTFDAYEFSGGRTIIASVVVPVLVVAAVLGIVVAASCPFIYSYDGEHYVFDGEPYGGATMQALERTDWSLLDHLKLVDGAYRLMLTNEMEESQHTNRLSLLVVDHDPGSTVVMDRQGVAHAFRTIEEPAAARDENGADLRVWLRDTDKAHWYPDLERYSARDSVADTRNHITLRFRRPPRGQRAWLVSNAATGIWGSHMIRSMLSWRGDRVDEFYAAVNGTPLYRTQLLEWNEREELFELFVEVRHGDGWVKQDFVPGGGPFIGESRAIPLDLQGVATPEVEIRVHPPIGFWSLNSLRLAWEDVPPRVTRLTAQSVKDQDGVDVSSAVAHDDSLYLVFPTQKERAELVFAAPPAVEGMKRTLFAETRGWYQLHLHAAGPPDHAAIQRLTFEPGFAVRRSLQELREYRRTGALLDMNVEADSVGWR